MQSTDHRPEQKVFVSRQLPGDALQRLARQVALSVWPGAKPPARDELKEALADASGFISMPSDRIDDELLASAPNLRVVSNMAVGFDNFDVEALTRHGIPAGNTPGVLTDATADLAIGLMIAAARRFEEGRRSIVNGQWQTWDPSAMLGLELRGAVLGIVGLGRIGTAVATRARAFGMEVVACTRHPHPVDGVRFVGLDELCSIADVISLHVSLSAETRQLIGARELSLMKSHAIVVNTARGAVVDQRALVEALASRRIAGAGLDVFEPEPLAPNDPLLELDNCVVVPHIGSATERTRAAMADLAVDNVLAGLSGARLVHCVNPEVYDVAH
jgi:glyoxylate reductase